MFHVLSSSSWQFYTCFYLIVFPLLFARCSQHFKSWISDLHVLCTILTHVLLKFAWLLIVLLLDVGSFFYRSRCSSFSYKPRLNLYTNRLFTSRNDSRAPTATVTSMVTLQPGFTCMTWQGRFISTGVVSQFRIQKGKTLWVLKPEAYSS